MKIEPLYFDGCPSWQAGLDNLKTALHHEGAAAAIELVKVNDDADAEAKHFLGSPSFRVDGEELWPEARAQFALGCRVYHTPQGLKGAPTVEMLTEKIRNLSERKQDN
jgi:hypothetical protein